MEFNAFYIYIYIYNDVYLSNATIVQMSNCSLFYITITFTNCYVSLKLVKNEKNFNPMHIRSIGIQCKIPQFHDENISDVVLSKPSKFC